MKTAVLIFGLAVLGSGLCSEVIRSGSDSITYDEVTQIYSVRYRCMDDGQDYVVQFKQPTDFAARVNVDVARRRADAIEYTYYVENARQSHQAIQFVWVPVGSKDAESNVPAGWRSNVITHDAGYEMGWHVKKQGAIQPGRSQRLTLSERTLPVVGRIALSATSDSFAFCGEGPNAVVGAYLEDTLLSVRMNRVLVDAVVPGIKINREQPELMLDVLALEAGKMASKGGHQDIADELATDVTKAAASYRAQDVRSALDSLRQARELLHGRAGRDEHDDSEGREARRSALDALAFDLEYIAEIIHRSGGDAHGDHEHHDR